LVLRVAEVSVSIAIWVAVLAFGGTSPPFFFIAQVIILGLGVLLLAVSLLGPVAAVRFPVTAPLFLLVWVLLQVVPLGRHAPNTLSIAPYQTISHLLLLVTYLTAFYEILLVSEDPNAKRRLVYALVALGAFEAFYGLVQYLTGWQHIFAYAKKYYLEEATGTYINRNHFAGFLEMVLPFTVALALLRARNLRRVAHQRKAKLRSLLSAPELLPLIFFLFLAVAIFTALIFSRSRMGIISGAVSIVVVLSLTGTSSVSKWTRLAAAVLLLLGVIGGVIWVGTDPVVMRFETLGREYDQSGQNRVSIWHDTVKLIRQRPVVGTGLGTFSIAYTSVQTSFLTHLVDHAHCDYLELVSDLGVPGGIAVFGSILWILARAVQRYRKTQDRFAAAIYLGCIGGIVAILVHSLADFNLYIPANALVFTVTLALAAGERRSLAAVFDADA
jgi:O-antigen ligase